MVDVTKNVAVHENSLAALDDSLSNFTAQASETMKTMLARNQENKGVADRLELMKSFRENVAFDSPKATVRFGKG